MRRSAFLIALVCATAAVGATAVQADQTPYGNVGPPSNVATGTWTSSVVVPSTAGCPGFAPGDTLRFAAVSLNGVEMRWPWPPGPFFAYQPWRAIEEVTGSTVAGGMTYVLKGHYDSGITGAEDWYVSSKNSTITRSDGLRLSGPSMIIADHPYFPDLALYIGATSCK